MSSPRLPWEIQEARDVLAEAAVQQSKHQEVIKQAVKDAALADHLHRVAVAHKIAELRDLKVPSVLCSKLAQGDETVSLLGKNAAEAEGDREIAVQEGWRQHANRKDAQQLCEWSMRKDLAIDQGREPEPVHFQSVNPPRAA